LVWLPDGEKILMVCLFVLTEFTNVTDTRRERDAHTHTHTQTQTPHNDIWPRLHSIARQKLAKKCTIFVFMEQAIERCPG